MRQTIESSVTASRLPPRSDCVGNLDQWTAACIESLRQEASALRSQFPVQRVGADMKMPLEDVVHLLQKAAMLERGADVLALTSEELR